MRCLELSTPTNLYNFFDKHKNCFVKWRYSFEGGVQSYQINEVLIVMDALNQFGKVNLTKC